MDYVTLRPDTALLQLYMQRAGYVLYRALVFLSAIDVLASLWL